MIINYNYHHNNIGLSFWINSYSVLFHHLDFSNKIVSKKITKKFLDKAWVCTVVKCETCVWFNVMIYYFNMLSNMLYCLQPLQMSPITFLLMYGDQISASLVSANYHIGGIIENFFPSKELERFTKPTGELHAFWWLILECQVLICNFNLSGRKLSKNVIYLPGTSCSDLWFTIIIITYRIFHLKKINFKFPCICSSWRDGTGIICDIFLQRAYWGNTCDLIMTRDWTWQCVCGDVTKILIYLSQVSISCNNSQSTLLCSSHCPTFRTV